MHDGRRTELILHAARLKLAAPSGEYIFYPPAFSAIGERDHETVGLSKDIHRCPVELA